MDCRATWTTKESGLQCVSVLQHLSQRNSWPYITCALVKSVRGETKKVDRKEERNKGLALVQDFLQLSRKFLSQADVVRPFVEESICSIAVGYHHSPLSPVGH